MKKPVGGQFSGSLVGQCLGDALGFPVEGYVPDVCRQYVTGVLRRGKGGSVSRPPYPFGQYTDDSQLAREILLSYRDLGRFDAGDYASRIAALFTRGEVVGPGKATEEAALRVSAGVSWEMSGAPAPAAGNGSAMRAGPIGLLFWDDPGGLVKAAVDQGRITHRDSRCSGGAVAVAGAVALALRGEVERGPFLSRLARWSGSVDATMGEALGKLGEWLDLPPGEAVVRIGKAGLPSPPEGSRRGISPFVVGSVLWSLYSFLQAPDDYWETICLAISAGGDVDTMAAMAGAVSGAHLGVDALPSDLAGKLTDGGKWGFGELRLLAEDCYSLKEGEDPG